MTSVVHSMVHVAQTLKDFGPVQNYSTFNFESTVGTFRKVRLIIFITFITQHQGEIADSR